MLSTSLANVELAKSELAKSELAKPAIEIGYLSRLDRVCARMVKDKLYEYASSPKHAARSVIQELGGAGALDLGFLREGELLPGDITRIAETAMMLSSHDGTISTTYAVNIVFGGLFIALMGTDEQKAMLRKIQTGQCQLAFALTEPAHGSDAAGIQAVATPCEDGYSLDGEKIFTTGAENADYILVAARRSNCKESARALSIFLVPADTPGLTVEPLDKLAGNMLSSCRVVMKGVRIPASAVLGGDKGLDDAWRWMRITGAMERLTVAAEATGLAGAIVNRAMSYARQRSQFGQPIANFQSIQHRLVEIKTLHTTMSLLVDRAVRAMESGDDATEEVCTAKYYCAEQLQEIMAAGMRIMGGRAYFEFEDMARYYRQAPLFLYAGGTIEVQKNLIARSLKL